MLFFHEKGTKISEHVGLLYKKRQSHNMDGGKGAKMKRCRICNGDLVRMKDHYECLWCNQIYDLDDFEELAPLSQPMEELLSVISSPRGSDGRIEALSRQVLSLDQSNQVASLMISFLDRETNPEPFVDEMRSYIRGQGDYESFVIPFLANRCEPEYLAVLKEELALSEKLERYQEAFCPEEHEEEVAEEENEDRKAEESEEKSEPLIAEDETFESVEDDRETATEDSEESTHETEDGGFPRDVERPSGAESEIAFAKQAFETGRIEEAFAALIDLHDPESSEILNEIGKCYYKGDGCDVNFDKAFHAFSIAAQCGNPKAMCNLAHCYETGKGTIPNYEKAMASYASAARLGYPSANYYLALFYYLKQDSGFYDPSRGIEMLEAAANRGHVDSQFELGTRYYRGIDVPRDPEVSKKWLEQAAKGGSRQAVDRLNRYFGNNNESIAGSALERDE